MKIFISHSSKDKWAARRISEDLIKIGVATFLDEKDIETGQSIDVSIRKHLKECDDFLIILSPASVKSEWVLLELGGALALEKKIIPILLYVGANEIPNAINLKLARDINVISVYYDELSNVIRGSNKKVLLAKTKPVTSSLKVGDRVKIISTRPNDVRRKGTLIDWEPEMDQFLDRLSTISDTNLMDLEETYSIKLDKEEHVFAREWLVKI